METPPPEQQPPQMSPADERNWSMIAHLSALVTFVGIPGLIGPLVVWLFKREQSALVAENARNALNFNISVLIYAVAATVAAVLIAIFTFGVGLLVFLPVVLVALVLWLVFTIQGAIAGSRGEVYRYPFTIELVS